MNIVGIVIDVVVIAIMLISAFIGYKKGFFKSFLSLFSWVVCLIIAVFTAKYVATWINGMFNFSELIGNGIGKGLVGINEVFGKQISEFASKEEIISALNGTNGIVLELVKIVFNHTAVDMTSTSTIATVVGGAIGQVCMVIISGFLVFIVLKVVIALLSKLFDNITRIKILGGINKLLGLAFGAVKGAILVIVLNLALVGLSLIPAVNNTVTPVIQNNTTVEKVIYNETNEVVEKYVIEGELIQKWIDNLWANK